MKRLLVPSLLLALLGGHAISGAGASPIVRAERADPLEALAREFEAQSGARLVFEAGDLPPGSYFDRMPSLDGDGRLRAARIAVAEARKLPVGYFKNIGLRAVGVFAGCASSKDDGFHPYDSALGGYRYFGIWNGKDAVACACYSNDQLALTFHHEVFHHIDGTRRGQTDRERLARDPPFEDVRAGQVVYPALALSAADLDALKRRSTGRVLESSVSDYARKSAAEDRAETARYLMSHLADSLVQMATRSELPGSQRLLHVLRRYGEASVEAGPGPSWFVSVALGRPLADDPRPILEEKAPAKESLQEILGSLKQLNANPLPPEKMVAARALLRKAADLSTPPDADAETAQAVVREAAALVPQIVRACVQPRDAERAFTIHGREDADGVNRTLRQDVADFGRDAALLKQVARLTPNGLDLAAPAARQSLQLLAHYYVFIDSSWRVTGGTRQAFEAARDEILAALPEKTVAGLRATTNLELRQLAVLPDAAGDRAAAPLTPAPRPNISENPYLKRVDEAVADPDVRAAVRRVQPACVRIGGGSGVNLTPAGLVLTNAHVADAIGAVLTAHFPDGRSFKAVCIALDSKLDLALCRLDSTERLPYAPVAAEAPPEGTRIVCIGNPGPNTPSGEPTGYKAFHVSTGKIRGYNGDPLGNQSLGRLMHDAWTYWGHSGSPLFDETGRIVGLHNSWDSKTAMRHGVPLQAIRRFLRQEKVSEVENP